MRAVNGKKEFSIQTKMHITVYNIWIIIIATACIFYSHIDDVHILATIKTETSDHHRDYYDRR